MREVPAPAESALGVLVHTRKDRELAASHWLLTAADDMAQARKEWARNSIALLRCGGVFTAVRISAELVQAAADTEDLNKIDAYLAEALPGGPVFADTTSRLYYALVPASTARRQFWTARESPDAHCLGPHCYLGVPHPQYTEPYAARSYWCVPMDAPARCAVRTPSPTS